MTTVALHNGAPQSSDWLLACLEQVLRPIIRLFLSRRIAYPAFAETAKQIYIDLAREDAAARNPRQTMTVSELAIATGLDVTSINARLTDTGNGVQRAQRAASLSPEAEIVSEWGLNSTYADLETGIPRTLPIRGNGLSFAALVRRTRRNVSYGHVLDRLLESGNVELTEDGRSVRLVDRWYLPKSLKAKGVVEIFQAACRCLEHYLSSLNWNVARVTLGQPNTLFQQERYSRKVSPSRAQEFRDSCKEMLRRQTSESVDLIEPMEDPVQTREHLVAGVGYYYFELPPA